SEEAMPSKASSIYYDIETKRIAWLDYVLSAVYVYDENGKFVKQMEPSDSEFEKFSKIDIDTATYSMLKQNLLKVIYLKILNLNDKTVQLIGSLPRLYMTVEGSDTSVDYSNEMCIIDKGIDSASTIVSTIKFPEELNKKGFFPKHVNIYTYDSMILLPVYKGWPVIGSKGFDSTNYSASYNPFVDSFYDYTPLFYAIDTRNDSIKIVGNLSQQFKDDKSGYYNYRPKFIAKDNRLYFHDGYSGYFLVYDKKFKIIDTLFCLPAKKGIVRNTYNSNNTEQTPLEYLNATRMDIDTKIVDLKVVGNRLLLLYQYRDVMLLNNYNLTDRTSSIYKIDDKTNSTNKQNKYAISCTQDKALVTKVYDGIAKISFTKYIQL
ncbi:MAG: hypothetical protein KDC07_05800, partial [Chitinophagaceae bacterium]|nr:hypothetical protein [Chitinophagaceae bacterium]